VIKAGFDRSIPEFRAFEGLESFEVTLTKKRLHGDEETEPGYRTGIVATYSTDTRERLKDYVIVQLIRGCVFNTFRDGDRVIKHIGMGREWLDEETRGPNAGRREFRHPNWDFDSTDRDPVYATIPGHPLGRHAGYQVRRPDPFDSSSRRYLYQEAPRKPRLYVSDLLKDVHKMKSFEKAVNTSLEFATQLYREKDVPTLAAGARLPLRIAELEWTVRYQWSYAAGRFLPMSAIDPFCHSNAETQEMSLAEYESELQSRQAGPEICLPD
jgi:hypothetical protein